VWFGAGSSAFGGDVKTGRVRKIYDIGIVANEAPDFQKDVLSRSFGYVQLIKSAEEETWEKGPSAKLQKTAVAPQPERKVSSDYLAWFAKQSQGIEEEPGGKKQENEPKKEQRNEEEEGEEEEEQPDLSLEQLLQIQFSHAKPQDVIAKATEPNWKEMGGEKQLAAVEKEMCMAHIYNSEKKEITSMVRKGGSAPVEVKLMRQERTVQELVGQPKLMLMPMYLFHSSLLWKKFFMCVNGVNCGIEANY